MNQNSNISWRLKRTTEILSRQQYLFHLFLLSKTWRLCTKRFLAAMTSHTWPSTDGTTWSFTTLYQSLWSALISTTRPGAARWRTERVRWIYDVITRQQLISQSVVNKSLRLPFRGIRGTGGYRSRGGVWAPRRSREPVASSPYANWKWRVRKVSRNI